MARNAPDPPGGRSLRKSGYHHGNLREALVSAARVLILEKGPHGFSLIETARLAGVSPAAPYRHFRDREALLAEVARRGYAKFSDSLEQAWAGGAPDRSTALRRLGHAYLDFALTERAYYAAMFEAGPAGDDPAEDGPAGDGPARHPAFHGAADRAYRTLAETGPTTGDAAGGSDTGAGPAIPPEAVFFHIWSLAHGAATLGTGSAAPALSRHRMLDLGVDLYLRGLGFAP